MSPGERGPGSNKGSSVPSKKMKASAVGNIIHEDQREDRVQKKRNQLVTPTEEVEEDMPNTGSRETSR